MLRKLLVGLLASLMLVVALPVLATTVTVTINAWPDKDPNVLNVKRPSLIPVYVYEGDLQSISCDGLTLQNVPKTTCSDMGGYLFAKFDGVAVIANLGTLHNDDTVTLEIRGTGIDGTGSTVDIYGTDTAKILMRGKAGR